MKRISHVAWVALAIASCAPAGQTQNQKPQVHSTQRPAAHSSNAPDGQAVFIQNCSRCHNAPEGFSSNISGTVAMHMRVRANLNQADYEALRRFLKP